MTKHAPLQTGDMVPDEWRCLACDRGPCWGLCQSSEHIGFYRPRGYYWEGVGVYVLSLIAVALLVLIAVLS